MITLSDQQNAGMAALLEFTQSSRQTFELNGFAGSGKTLLLTQFARDERFKSRLVAFTGKAASVLATKSDLPATTIHGIFYRLIDAERDEHGKKVLQFQRVEQNLYGEYILVDESSMVNEAIGADLIRTGAKIIAVGDPGQLPPVVGKAFFCKPDFMLTEIHRQALESPIVRQAHAMRESGYYQADTEQFRVVRKLNDEELINSNIILSFTNKTRHAMNKRMRRMLGRAGIPRRGEPVMCLKNNRRYGIFNGAIYTLAEDFNYDADGIGTILLENPNDSSSVIAISNVGFVSPGGKIDDFDDAYQIATAFDYAYCSTVHKSQGSEYTRVALLDEYNRPEARREWCYTAITRASESIVIQR